MAELLAAHRVVTVTGPGGAGKTRLAVRVASELDAPLPDGVWFADLRNARDGSDVSRSLADAVGLAPSPGRALLDQLSDHLRAWRCLLILDNCEHLREVVAATVEDLLSRARDVRVLATSRVLLDVAGEVVVQLGDLGLPDDASPDEIFRMGAGALFAARARLARPDLLLGPDDATSVAAVCRLVDGLPLGIELAAAQLRLVDLVDLPAHLTAAGGRLRGGRRRSTSRHASLDDVVAASHRLLDDDEQALFDRLAVFAGSFSMAAVGPVTGVDDHHVAELVGSLVDQSMLVRVGGRSTRFRLLDMLHRFAFDRLQECGGTVAARERHLAWAMGLVDELEVAMRTPEQDATLLRMRDEHEELRAARAWARAQGDELAALRITASAPIDPEPERDRILGEMMDGADDVPDDLRARVSYTCAAAALERGAFAELERFAREADTLFSEIGEEGQAAYAGFLGTLGTWGASDDPELGVRMTIGLERFEALDEPMGCALRKLDPGAVAARSRARRSSDGPTRRARRRGFHHGRCVVRAGPCTRRTRLRAPPGCQPRTGGGGGARRARRLLEKRQRRLQLPRPRCDGSVALGLRPRCDAAELLGAAVALRTSVGANLRPWEQRRHVDCMATIEARLDRVTLRARWRRAPSSISRCRGPRPPTPRRVMFSAGGPAPARR